VTRASADIHEVIYAELVDSGVNENMITPEARMDDLDIDSVDVEELLATIENRYSVVITSTKLAEMTIGGLVDTIAAQRVSA